MGIQKVQLYGPTYFNEIIQTAASSAASMHNDNESEQNYVILLIITDGIINDMKQTIDAVVGATELPLSIIIVGVGDADFSAMSKQPTMNNLYDGPSTLVNQQTQKNLYPDVKANAPQNQPVNPYYAQGQAQPQAAYAQPGQ